jgi:hypothetical protein
MKITKQLFINYFNINILLYNIYIIMYTIVQFLYYFDFRSFLSQFFETLTFRTISEDHYIQNVEEGEITIER